MSRTRLDRAVFRLYPKAADFLKAYTSNTQDKPRTAFVDLKGKIVATADQIVLSSDEALVAVERPFAAALKVHLKNYLFLTGTAMEETPYAVAFDEDPSASAEHSIPWLGGKLLFSKDVSGDAPGEGFTRLRLARAWPLQGIDYSDELLLSVGDAEYVSYDKGCYLGQEIIARVHYKGKPPRVLAVVDAAERPDTAGTLTSRAVVGGKTLGFAFL
jgi:folate-binding protein YgfZ